MTAGPVVRVRFRRVRHGAVVPRYMTEGSVGLDLTSTELVRLEPGERCLMPTGWSAEIPAGYEGQVRPRSGLALRHGVTVLNAPGTIDHDYRGEIMVLLVNLGQEGYLVEPGARIAQLVIAPVVRVAVEEAAELSQTERGSGGLGHTG